jgi:TPR repeat protein
MNAQLAAHYYRLSAHQGHAGAQCNYAILLEAGEIVEMNKELAAHYYKMCADQG